MLCLSFANPANAMSISGLNVVCVGTTQNYTEISGHTGCSYTWTITPASGGIVTGTSPAVPVTWTSLGNYTLKVVADSALTGIDSTTITVAVIPPPQLFITTNSETSCQSFDTTGVDPTGGYILTDTAGCVKVCAGRTATYYANGGSAFAGNNYYWAVTGGSIIGPNNGSAVTVTWISTATGGSITLSDTTTAGCMSVVSLCVRVIPRPMSGFAIDNKTLPVVLDTVCINTPVQFKDLSVADSLSSITSWYYMFGDDSVSSEKNPVHTYHTAGGPYLCQLVVTNACGCTDTFRTFIMVTIQPGPTIYCPQVVCQGDSIAYSASVPPGCGSVTYNWSWDTAYATPMGLPPYTHQTLTLKWKGANADGYGTVSLSENGCATVCTGTTTIKVPVVQSSPKVTGPTSRLLCAGVPYQFSIPLWPGTQYDWGVIGDPSAVISGRHNNVVAVQFSSAGTYRIHVWYQNKLKLCGGDLKITVVVVNPTTITGPTSWCANSGTATYSLSGGYSAKWTLNGPYSAPITFTGTSYNANLDSPGTYVLTASGTGFCPPSPLYISVYGSPPVDSITGPQVACETNFSPESDGYVYTYHAKNPMPGYTFKWIIPGAYTVTSLTGDSVSVIWDTLPETIEVFRVSVDTPYCSGPRAHLTVEPFTNNPLLIGDTVACANSYQAYSETVLNFDNIVWGIVPDTLGSIVGGYENSANINVLWHNVSTTRTAQIFCNITQCANSAQILQNVTLNPSPAVSLSTSPSTACNHSTVTLTATGSDNSYTWNFGDGTTKITSGAGGNVTTHQYAVPPGASTVSLTATVTASGTASSGCPVLGQSRTTVQIKPGPTPSMYTRDPLNHCGSTPFSDTFYSAVKNGVAPITYQWYRNGTAISGSIGDTLINGDTGTFFLVVNDGAGCSNTSDSIKITNIGACIICSLPTMSLSTGCNVITSTGSTVGTSPVYTATGGTVVTSGGGYNATITYPKPGYYEITLKETFGSCSNTAIVLDSVPLVSNFYWNWTCTRPTYTVNFHDNSAYLATWGITSYNWVVKSGATTVATGSGANWSTSLGYGRYSVTETATAKTTGGTATQTCMIVDTIVVPGVPSLAIHDSLNSLCEGIPTNFSPIITPLVVGTLPVGIANYIWKFGDSSVSLLANTQRSLTYKFGRDPNLYTNTLIITDTLGCTDTANANDTIYENLLGGAVVTDNDFLCNGKSDTLYYGVGPLSFSIGNPTSFLWSDGTTDSMNIATVSGNYWVEVRDIHHCYEKTQPWSVIITNPAGLTITGNTSYCQGETVALSDNLGAGYTYQWLKNGLPITGATHYYLLDPGEAPGRYRYQLAIKDTISGGGCLDTSANDTVTIHSLPAKPTISSVSVINCPTYELKLTTTSLSAKFTYNWSNSKSGAIDTIYTGGAYRVYVTDTNGCINYTDTLIPNSPESYMAWFPSGCYMLCSQSSPDSLPGPPGTFNSWAWLLNNTVVSSSGNDTITSLRIVPTGGFYQLQLSNGLCATTSDTLNVGFEDCGTSCPNILPNTITLTCDTAAAGYKASITLTNTNPTDTLDVTIGLSIGPAVPFSVVLPPASAHTYSMSFTTLRLPAYSPITLAAWFNAPGLSHPCYETRTITTVPSCSGWPAERLAGQTAPIDTIKQVATGMIVYPNPAGSAVNVNYNYGYEGDAKRRIVLYDMTGRVISTMQVNNETGTVTIPTANFTSGSYIVRMEENNQTLHVDHVSIIH